MYLFSKRILFALICLVFFPWGNNAHSSTIKDAFDQIDASFNGGLGYSQYNNINATLAWGESYVMMGYMSMYHATGHPHYLQKLYQHALNVIAERDDNAGRVDYRGISDATWVCEKYSDNQEPYAWVVHSGMITYPMADFCDVIFSTPSLHNFPTLNGQTMLAAAQWLSGEVQMTIAAHDDQWDTTLGIYRARNAPFLGWISNKDLPHNQYAAMGRTLLKMYSVTGDPQYLNKSIHMALYFNADLTLGGNGAYTWHYHPQKGPEDLSHGAIETDFAQLAADAGVFFTATDVTAMAHTFKRNLYGDPLEFADRVDGTNGPNTYIGSTGRWLGVGENNRDNYHIILDYYFERIVYGTGGVSTTLKMIAFANLERYRKLLEPVAIYRGLGSGSEVADMDGGDFDNDGIDEIILVRNYDGNMYMYELNANKYFTSVASYTGYGSNSDWAGVAAGDFDPSHPGEEFVAVRNFDANFYLCKLSGGNIVPYSVYTGAGSASQWAGIAAGDFDNDGVDEFVAARNFDGNIYMYEYNGSNIVAKASYTGFGSGSAWVDLDAADLDPAHAGDEFVAVRNFDGNIYVMGLSGNSIVSRGTYTAAGSGSNWRAVTAGDFDGDRLDEFVAHRDYDGDFYFYYLQNGTVYNYGREYHPQNTLKQALGCGSVEYKGQRYDNLFFNRRFDGDNFVFKASKLPHRQDIIYEDEYEDYEVDRLPGKWAGVTAEQIRLYPNPAVDQVHLQWTSTCQQVQLVDLQGKVLRSATPEGQELNWDVRELARGAYFVRFEMPTGSVARRLVLQ